MQHGTAVSVGRLPAHCHHRAPSASIIRQYFQCTITCISSRLGDRAFAAAGPRLSTPLTYVDLICPWDNFSRKLKTYLTV